MSKTKDGSGPQNGTSRYQVVPDFGVWFWIVLGTILIAGSVTLILIGCKYFNAGPDRGKFLTESFLAFLVLVIVGLQAYIYRQQAKIMSNSLVVSNSSQIDIDHIKTTVDHDLETIVLRIGNIGHTPADGIKVWVEVFYQVFDNYKKQLDGVRPKHQQGYAWDFGKSKLFPGNLRIVLYVPVYRDFSKELPIINAGRARFIAQIKIRNGDGFGIQESDFAFRFTVQSGTKDAGWLTYPVRDRKDLLTDLYQGESEQPQRYEIK